MGGAAYALRGVGVCEVGGLVPAVHKCERDITHTSTQVRVRLVVSLLLSTLYGGEQGKHGAQAVRCPSLS